MKQENQNFLINTYPFFKREPTGRSSFDLFGFECGDGWFQLIKNLSEELNKLGVTFKVAQVKEKFGTLRFYVSITDDNASDEQHNKIIDLINSAEARSASICEDCGKYGEIRTRNFRISTLCDECFQPKNGG